MKRTNAFDSNSELASFPTTTQHPVRLPKTIKPEVKNITIFYLPEHFAIDLSEIVLPWSPGSLESYEGRRFNLKFDETLQTYVGIVSHFKRNDVCCLDE